MSNAGSRRAVVAALLANLAIAVAKFVAFAVTGASSMLAEAVHSVADTGNQGLLMFGGRRAQRDADERHPFGYGRDRYFYAFVVALVLFSLGSLFALYEGVHKILDPHPIEDPAVAFIVLGVAVVLETFSFRTAFRESKAVKTVGISWPEFIRRTKEPELPVVLLEDTAALIGLFCALVGVGAAVITDDGRWDGAGTLAISALLAFVASVLAVEMKSLLIGEAASAGNVADIEAALLGGPEVSRVIHLRTMHLGPDELLVAAKIAVEHDDTAAEVARGIDAAEKRVRAAVPIARLIYLEPDLDRSTERG
ncbi:MAG: cation diffusion facilitator family transporter [Actinomycetes bacterium]